MTLLHFFSKKTIVTSSICAGNETYHKENTGHHIKMYIIIIHT